METTALYVELIIIGLETSLWITSFIIYLTNLSILKYVGILLEKMCIRDRFFQDTLSCHKIKNPLLSYSPSHCPARSSADL